MTRCALILVALAFAACARSGLYGPDYCAKEGAQRECSNDCGPGIQMCLDEAWTACDVPKTERACTAICGAGVATCENGEWSACDVPPMERECYDACGAGVATCRNDEWGACRVAPTENVCSNACGEGTAACVDGRLLDCVVPPRITPCSTLCGSGSTRCADGVETACDAPLPGPPTWKGTVRDFLEAHPDFELPFENDHSELGLVESTLGDDGKPVYAGGAGTATTSGRENFDGWFRDVPGTNRKTYLELPFTAEAGRIFAYSGADFFPVDGRLFGNEGRPHNYHFTYEAHTEFDYVGDGGDFLAVEGDDDIWVFVNRRLVIDLGGLHEARSARVDLDAERARLGLAPGGRYPVDLFFAERHTISSSLVVHTTLTAREFCP